VSIPTWVCAKLPRTNSLIHSIGVSLGGRGGVSVGLATGLTVWGSNHSSGKIFFVP